MGISPAREESINFVCGLQGLWSNFSVKATQLSREEYSTHSSISGWVLNRERKPDSIGFDEESKTGEFPLISR